MRKVLLLFLLLAIGVGLAQAQQRTVTGVVTDASDGSPLPLANVQIKGTSSGTITDNDGRFSLQISGDGVVLVFFYTGYETQEISVAGQTTLNVALKSANEEIDQVVVTGYGARKREVVSAAVTTIGGEQMKELPSTVSLDNMLQGRAAGVEATALNGKPGTTATVRVRGAISLNLVGGDKALPLYVVDGIPVSADDMNAINPADIENVSVLKDAAASAVYGSRGANGVIVVTTRQGKEGEATISYSGRYGWGRKVPDPFKMMNAEEKMDYEVAAGVATYTDDERKLNISREHNWQKDILGTSRIQSHVVSATGALKGVNYYLSGSFDDNTGIIRELSGFRRYGARLNLSTKIKKFVTAGANFALSHSRSDEPRDRNNSQNPFRGMYSYNPYEPVWVLDNSNNKVLDENGQPQYNPTSMGLNIIEAMKGAPSIDRNTRLLGSASLDFDIWRGIHFISRFTGNYGIYSGGTYTKPFSQLDDYVGDKSARGSRTVSGSQDFQYGWLNQLEYTWTFADVHGVHAYLFSEFTRFNLQTYSFSKKGFPSPNLEQMDVASAVNNAGGRRSEWALFSLAGGVDYDYAGRYMGSISVRRDGASRFGKNNRYGWFWSVSAGWNIAKESFMKPASSWLNVLKLTASYGVLGSWMIPNYAAQDYFTFGNYNNLTAAVITSRVGNPDLSWERQSTVNAGLEFGLFDYRLSGSVGYFRNVRDGFLFSKDLLWEAGGYDQYQNAGKMHSQGVELSLNGTLLRVAGLTWGATANITFMQYKIDRLAGEKEIDLSEVVLREGETPFTFSLPHYEGVDSQTGKPLYSGEDGKVVDKYDYAGLRKFLRGKSTLPKGFGGFGTYVTYKGIDFSADFSFKYGNYILNYMAKNMISDGDNAAENQRKEAANYWKKPGDNQLPALNSGAGDHNSDRFLQDGSYLRFRSITLGYTLPVEWTRKILLEKVRFYVQGQNIFTATKFEGDPEVSVGSGESQLGSNQTFVSGAYALYSYPAVRSIMIGLDIKF